MGAAAIPIAIGASIVGDMFQASAAADATAAQEAQLQARKKQEEIAEKSRSIQRADNLQKVVSSNIALAASRGESPVSGSFKAIERTNFDKFNEDENMDELNTLYKEQYIDAQAAGVQASGEAQEVAPFLKTAADAFRFI